MTELQKRLFALRDEKYGGFTAKLNPTIDPETIIGVRLPELRAIAKELRGTPEQTEFLRALPHTYLEENHLHSFIISYIKDFGEAVAEAERFLPYVDNWAVCDSMRVKAFGKDTERLLPYVEKWLKSDHPYTVRFAMLCLMCYCLDARFDERYPEMVAEVRSDEYYVNMMAAWYFATALAKQYDTAIKYIEDRRLDKWTHNKAIQKAIESYRVTDEHKAYLRTLKIK